MCMLQALWLLKKPGCNKCNLALLAGQIRYSRYLTKETVVWKVTRDYWGVTTMRKRNSGLKAASCCHSCFRSSIRAVFNFGLPVLRYDALTHKRLPFGHHPDGLQQFGPSIHLCDVAVTTHA